VAGSLAATPLQDRLLTQQTTVTEGFPAATALPGAWTDATKSGAGKSRFLKSLLIPGWGQAEEGRWLKAGIYWAVEATLITGAVMAHRQGQERDREFKAYADEYWDFYNYRTLRNHSHEWGTNETVPDTSYSGIIVIGDQNGSHELPGSWEEGWNSENDPYLEHYVVDRTQQYYEMIGKYAQFGRGWADYGINVPGFEQDPSWQGITYFSPNNLHYMHLRDLSNASFRLSTNLIMGTLLNHFVSALDQILFGDNDSVRLSSRFVSHRPLVTLQFNFQLPGV